jgi:hypothetical protein
MHPADTAPQTVHATGTIRLLASTYTVPPRTSTVSTTTPDRSGIDTGTRPRSHGVDDHLSDQTPWSWLVAESVPEPEI